MQNEIKITGKKSIGKQLVKNYLEQLKEKRNEKSISKKTLRATQESGFNYSTAGQYDTGEKFIKV